MRIRTLDDLDLSGKRVLVRVDFNVPLNNGAITDDTRIRATLPTIRALKERGAAVVLMSHLGRPKGQVREDLRLRPVAARLGELLGEIVSYAHEVTGPAAMKMAEDLGPGEVGMIENLRFDQREELNDPDFAKELAKLGDCFVADAFGAAHRAHASTVGVAAHLPSAAGLLMQKEVSALSWVLSAAEQPFVVILGGAKVSDKIDVIKSLMRRSQRLIIGGGMANTFLKAQGINVGSSLVEDDNVDTARMLADEARDAGIALHLPVDGVVATELSADVDARRVQFDEIADAEMILDIGPKTIEEFLSALKGAKTIVWNGPMGVFEIPQFAAGTRAVAEAVASADAYSLVGGGDSVAAIEQLGLADRISHISTGGGASLEFLEGKELPGVAVVLNDQKER